MNQIVITGLLQRMGHRVTIAANGVEAVSALQNDAFDLILMDVQMPELDGLGATRMIRLMDRPVCAIPVIALTANVMTDDAADCQAAGMNDFLSKPIEPTALRAVLEKWSEQKPAHINDGSVSGFPVLATNILEDMEAMLGRDQVVGFAQMFSEWVTRFIAGFKDNAEGIDILHEAHNLTSIAGNLGCLESVEAARLLSAAMRQKSPDVDQLTSELVAAATRALSAVSERFGL